MKLCKCKICCRPIHPDVFTAVHLLSAVHTNQRKTVTFPRIVLFCYSLAASHTRFSVFDPAPWIRNEAAAVYERTVVLFFTVRASNLFKPFKIKPESWVILKLSHCLWIGASLCVFISSQLSVWMWHPLFSLIKSREITFTLVRPRTAEKWSLDGCSVSLCLSLFILCHLPLCSRRRLRYLSQGVFATSRFVWLIRSYLDNLHCKNKKQIKVRWNIENQGYVMSLVLRYFVGKFQCTIGTRFWWLHILDTRFLKLWLELNCSLKVRKSLNPIVCSQNVFNRRSVDEHMSLLLPRWQ